MSHVELSNDMQPTAACITPPSFKQDTQDQISQTHNSAAGSRPAVPPLPVGHPQLECVNGKPALLVKHATNLPPNSCLLFVDPSSVPKAVTQSEPLSPMLCSEFDLLKLNQDEFSLNTDAAQRVVEVSAPQMQLCPSCGTNGACFGITSQACAHHVTSGAVSALATSAMDANVTELHHGPMASCDCESAPSSSRLRPAPLIVALSNGAGGASSTEVARVECNPVDETHSVCNSHASNRTSTSSRARADAMGIRVKISPNFSANTMTTHKFLLVPTAPVEEMLQTPMAPLPPDSDEDGGADGQKQRIPRLVQADDSCVRPLSRHSQVGRHKREGSEIGTLSTAPLHSPRHDKPSQPQPHDHPHPPPNAHDLLISVTNPNFMSLPPATSNNSFEMTFATVGSQLSLSPPHSRPTSPIARSQQTYGAAHLHRFNSMSSTVYAQSCRSSQDTTDMRKGPHVASVGTPASEARSLEPQEQITCVGNSAPVSTTGANAVDPATRPTSFILTTPPLAMASKTVDKVCSAESKNAQCSPCATEQIHVRTIVRASSNATSYRLSPGERLVLPQAVGGVGATESQSSRVIAQRDYMYADMERVSIPANDEDTSQGAYFQNMSRDEYDERVDKADADDDDKSEPSPRKGGPIQHTLTDTERRAFARSPHNATATVTATQSIPNFLIPVSPVAASHTATSTTSNQTGPTTPPSPGKGFPAYTRDLSSKSTPCLDQTENRQV